MPSSVGAGLCSARGCRFHWKNRRSRAPPLQRVITTSPQKGADRQIWSAPSICGRYSTATSCKFGTPRIRRRVAKTRKVTTERNAKLKHWFPPEFRGRTHQTHPSAPFLPLLFRQDGKEGAAGGDGSRRFATTSQSAALTAPLEGEPFGDAKKRGCWGAAAGGTILLCIRL